MVSFSPGDSGVGPDSNPSSRNPSAEGAPLLPPPDEDSTVPQEFTPVVYSFLVEECILAAYTPPATLTCPLHSTLILAQIAPDTVSSQVFFGVGIIKAEMWGFVDV